MLGRFTLRDEGESGFKIKLTGRQDSCYRQGHQAHRIHRRDAGRLGHLAYQRLEQSILTSACMTNGTGMHPLFCLMKEPKGFEGQRSFGSPGRCCKG